MRTTGGRAAALCLLALGAALGAWARAPTAAPARAGGFVVLAADFHVHSFLGDGGVPPWELPAEARRRGLDVIAVTGHNRTWPGRLARWAARHLGGALTLPGQEVTNSLYHLAAVGIEAPVDFHATAADAIAAVHAQGGVAIAAHPDPKFARGFDVRAQRALDGAERMHPSVFRAPGGSLALAGFFERASAGRPSLAAIGSSDFHAMSALGLCRTYVFAREASAAGVLEALRSGRTVTVDERGRPVGPPNLVALLGEPPVPPLPRATVGGVCAWLGLVGLVVFAPSRRRADGQGQQ